MFSLLLHPMAKYAALGAAIIGLVLWLRIDAVKDFRADLERQRAEDIQDAREIENTTRNDSDDAILDCLSGRGC